MSYLFGLLGILVVVLAVGLIVNRKAVMTLWFNARSLVGAGARSVDNHNAVVNMHQAVDDAKSEISSHTAKLNKSQGQIASLTRESNDAGREVGILTTRVRTRAAEVGGDTNDSVLLALAAQLSATQIRAADASSELVEQTALHNQVLEQVKEAVLRADELEKEADRMGVKLDLSSSRAELASVGINFQKSSAHSKLADAENYKKQIQQQIDTNNGAVEVAKQLNPVVRSTEMASWTARQDAKAVLEKMGIGKSEPANSK